MKKYQQVKNKKVKVISDYKVRITDIRSNYNGMERSSRTGKKW